MGELQTFSIKIWLDIYAERLRHKVKCQLFQIQLLSINNTFLLHFTLMNIIAISAFWSLD